MDKSLMLNQIKEHYKIKSAAEFARFLGITTANMYTWLKRNTYDPAIILAKCQDIRADWLLTGEGEMIKKPEPQMADPVQSIYDNITIPRMVWEVIQNQAASLKAKDEQVGEVITLLKEQIKRGNLREETEML